MDPRRPSSACRHLLPVNGEKGTVRNAAAHSVTPAIGEGIDESAPLPVHGERMPAGR